MSLKKSVIYSSLFVMLAAYSTARGENNELYSRARADARLLPAQPIGDRVIQIDGDLSEWQMPTDSFPIHQLLDHTVPEFHKSWKREWEEHATDAAVIKLLYSDDALYIAVKVADNSVVSPPDEDKRLHGDVVDVYLDLRPISGDGPGPGHVKYTDGIYQLVFAPPSPEGQPVYFLQPENEMFTGWRTGEKVARIGTIDVKASLFEGGYAIEIRLPLASLPHKPASDRLSRPFGFEVMIADKDSERAKGQPDRMYYSCSGYSGGSNYFKSPATIACTDPDLRTALPLSRLRINPLKTAPGGDECEGWIVTSLAEKNVAASFVQAAATVPGYRSSEAGGDSKDRPLTSYLCPALGLAFHHRRVLNRLPAWSPSVVGNRYVPVHPAAERQLKIDGILDDWTDFASSSAKIYEFGSMPWCAGIDGRNDSAAYKLMCNSDTLYLAVQVKDESVVCLTEEGRRFVGDCVHVFLDVRNPNDAKNSLSHGKYGEGVHHLKVAPSSDGKREASFTRSQKRIPQAGQIEYGCTKTSSGYVVEMAIPLSGVLPKPTSGRYQRPFGFEVLISDVDRDGNGDFLPRIQYAWGPGTETELERNPGYFNCADFLPNRLPEIRAMVDASPVKIVVDADQPLQSVSGFGGNYFRDGLLEHTGGRSSRFALSAATTRYVSENITPRWIRANLYLFPWEWVNDNESPDKSSLNRFEKLGHPHEYPGPHYKVQVDNYLKLLREYVKEDTSVCAYVENLPAWLFTDKTRKHSIPRAMWPELAECISSYMVYARDEFQIKFSCFAFRRARWGHPQFSDEEYPEVLKFLGAHFEKQGLKTKLLLCDTDSVNNFRWYARLANDPEILKYVAGLGLETSGPLTSQMANYRLWSDLARHMNLPLLVTGFGRPYTSTTTYLFEEVRVWQQMLRELSPNAAIIRQFVSEKSNKWLMVHGKEIVPGPFGIPEYKIKNYSDERDGVLVTQRFWITKQFCDLTPSGMAIHTRSDHPQVLVTGFTGRPGLRTVYTLHVANLSAARKAVLSGLPRKVKRMHVVRTSGGEGFHDAGDVIIKSGGAEVELPAWSLVTLTTLPKKVWQQ